MKHFVFFFTLGFITTFYSCVDLSCYAGYKKWNGNNWEILPAVLNYSESWAFNFFPREEYPLIRMVDLDKIPV